ncbi:hypothetical protein Tco_1295428 [Tanacetum coccineum]
MAGRNMSNHESSLVKHQGMPRGQAKKHKEWVLLYLIHSERKHKSITTDCHAGNPCVHKLDPTNHNHDPIIGNNQGMILTGASNRNQGLEGTMAGVDINTLTMKQYLALSRENQASGMVKPEIGGNGPIPGMTPTQALTAIQTMAGHSQKWHDGTSSRNVSSNSNTDGLATIIRPRLDKERPLNEEVKQVEHVNYGEFGHPTPFNGSNGAKFCVIPELKSNLPEQMINHYVEPYVPPIPFPNRLKQHAEEALVHETMESLKKIKINQPLYKEIRQTDNYPRYMKDLVANKQLTEEDDEVSMNPRCSALLQNQLPLKENDPGSFILPRTIIRLDFNNALADLGVSINIMPFSMFKRLGIGKLEPINMVIEMADNTKCIPKRIVKNLLIKIDKFILPIDFVILDIIEDFRMPVILRRPLLAIAYAKVDIFRKTISLEVGNEKVIFKMRSNFSDIIHESVRMIKTQGADEDDDDLEGNIDYLEPTLYDGFIDSDDEKYKERKCGLLGMPYIKPPLILIEKVKVTRYSVGPGEVYIKIKVLEVEELSRTRGNIATIRAGSMEEILGNDDEKESYDAT